MCIFDETGHAVADLITKKDEKVDLTQPFRYVDPERPWKNRYFENCTARKLQEKVIEKGRRLTPKKNIKELADFVKMQLNQEIWPEEQRFENPHKHYLDMSPEYYELKMSLLHEMRDDL